MSGPNPRTLLPLTAIQRKRILQSSRAGKSTHEIAAEMGLDGRQVAGVIRFNDPARRPKGNFGRKPKFQNELQMSPEQILSTELPVQGTPVPSSQEPLPVSSEFPVSVSPPSQPQPPTKESLPMSPEFSWQNNAPATPGSPGIGYTGQTIRIEVERVYPPDGFLGSHGTLTREEMGKIYGSGTYTLTRFEPGKQTMVAANVVIGTAYGEPRSPKRHQEEQGYPSRFRMGGQAGDGTSPFRAAFSGHQQQAAQESPSSTMKNIVDATEKIMDLSAKRTPPTPAPQESGLTEIAKELVKTAQQGTGQDFFRQWLVDQEKTRERERRDDAERHDREKKDDAERRERERKDEESRWQKIEQLERGRVEAREREQAELHKWELERIRADNDARHRFYEEERKTLMGLEDKKREAMVEQHKAEMKLLEKKLEENGEQMESFQAQMREERDRDRAHDLEILKLNQDRLQVTNKYEQEKIELMRKQAESANTEQTLMGVLKDVVQKADHRIGQHYETEQIKAAMADVTKSGADVGQLLQGVAGNVLPGTATPEPPKANGNGSGNGHKKEEMVPLIDKFINTPAFQEICEEWAAHVEEGVEPSIFSNTILASMSMDSQPDLKLAATMFQTYTSPRKWSKVFDAIKAHVKPEVAKIFALPYAEEFYEGFRAILRTSINGHYAQMLEATQKPAEPVAAVNRVAEEKTP